MRRKVTTVHDVPGTLLPYPHFSTSAQVLKPDDVEDQYILAAVLYRLLVDGTDPACPAAAMWRGCPGALLYWWGCLAAQMPGGPMDCPGYVQAWTRAYRASQMAVGPLPWWLGDTGYHLRCQSQLIARNPAYAGQFVHAPLELAWWWPTGENEWQIEGS